ncbi:hypothetical protein [Naasia sp. SYSU D00948]|uniref:hypothetical protein n=1 Tax=Naasia sp. SYSU D00948 TaxID=2817379 RepID=UPI001B31505D|nr:hypothetical protein [Naasia sp. SYSU D00948]
MSDPEPDVRRSPVLGIAAVVVAAAAILNLVFPVLGPLAVLGALGLGIAAVVTGRGRWPGVAALALAGALLLAFVASGLGFTFNPRQQGMLAAAAAIPPPEGFEVADPPVGIGYCGWFAIACDQAEVVWSYRPTEARSDAAALCRPYLEWAEARGVRNVFVLPASEWRGWYDAEADGMYGKGGERTYTVGSEEALRVCLDVVGHPPRADAPLAERLLIVGTTSLENESDIFVAQIARSQSIPDGSDDPSRGPFMIIGSLHKR